MEKAETTEEFSAISTLNTVDCCRNNDDNNGSLVVMKSNNKSVAVDEMG